VFSMFCCQDVDDMVCRMKLVDYAVVSDSKGIFPLMVSDKRFAFKGFFGRDSILERILLKMRLSALCSAARSASASLARSMVYVILS